MNAAESLDFDLPGLLPVGWNYRDYQIRCLGCIEAGWAKFSRQMIVLACGSGKTILFSAETYRWTSHGGRVLILVDTNELVEQAVDKLLRSTGIVADIEKADSRASLSSKVVVASIQTISRMDRLTGFPDDHFALVIADECDLSMSITFQRVLRYFCFGRESLAEGWKLPPPGETVPTRARVLGVTATPYHPDLGTFYQNIAFKYGLKEAVRDGWLVKPVVRQLPINVDMSGIRIARSSNGADLSAEEVIARLTPFLASMCAALIVEVEKRRTIVFVPSVEIAKNSAALATGLGASAGYVSGECADRTQKIEEFRNGRPQILFCALLLKRGFDDPGVEAVAIWRATKLVWFYIQCVCRASRPLAGLVDGCFGKDERLKAIAASSKPSFLILDPVWISDRLDLCKPCDLVASSPEVREKMARDDNPDLLQSEAEASIELLASLAKEAGKHAHKKARTIDPLNFAGKIKDEAVTNYAPAENWEFLPPTDEQIAQLRKWGFETERVVTRGLATKLIDRKIARDKLGLCTPAQMEFLERVGYQNPQNFSKDRATEILVRHRKGWAAKKQRASESVFI